MTIRKKKGFNIQPILEKLSEIRKINDDGSVSLSGFGLLDEFESYLTTAVFAKNQTDSFVRQVVKKAMNTEQEMTEGTFLGHCNSVATDLWSKGRNEFKVVFPIWGAKNLVDGRRRWGDVSISFDINQNTVFARRARKERTSQLKKRANSATKSVKRIEELPLCVCSVKAINIWDAFEKAETAISKELGLYSIFMSRGKFIISQDPDTPINRILLAPHMTVHSKTGKLSADVYWYSRWPVHLTEKHVPTTELLKRKEQAEDIRKCIRRLPWRQQAEQALVRHYSAFSQCDLEASFLDAWRLLESIAGHPREKAETLVKRAAWFFEEREFYYQMGLHLMHRRRLISHGRPVRDNNNESLAFQMKTFLSPFFHAFLTNPFHFKDLEELWEFCDLPVKKSVRRRQAYLLECSAKFRQEA